MSTISTERKLNRGQLAWAREQIDGPHRDIGGCRQGYIDQVFDKAVERWYPEPPQKEGVMVGPGDRVTATAIYLKRVLIVHSDQSHQERDGNSNIRCWLDSGAIVFMHPNDARFEDHPVLGVRQGKWSDDEMHEMFKSAQLATFYRGTQDWKYHLGEIGHRRLNEARS